MNRNLANSSSEAPQLYRTISTNPSKILIEATLERTGLSGIDAVRRIVETEGQARKTVDEAKARAQQIIAQAHKEGEMLRQEAVSSAQTKREEILKTAKEKAEQEARQSDSETQQLLQNYRNLAETRKDDAVDKAVELILSA